VERAKLAKPGRGKSDTTPLAGTKVTRGEGQAQATTIFHRVFGEAEVSGSLKKKRTLAWSQKGRMQETSAYDGPTLQARDIASWGATKVEPRHPSKTRVEDYAVKRGNVAPSAAETTSFIRPVPQNKLGGNKYRTCDLKHLGRGEKSMRRETKKTREE